MAKKKKTKKPLVSIELGFTGLVGLAVASFCIFLWMFLFGMWTGQSVLHDENGSEKVKELTGFSSKMWGEKSTAKREITQTSRKTAVKEAVVKTTEKEAAKDKDSSFFAVQVSAFKDKQRAVKAVMQWRARDYEAFYLMPDQPNGKFHRVFVGRFDSLVEANTLAAKLESLEQRKVFITLVSSEKERLP